MMTFFAIASRRRGRLAGNLAAAILLGIAGWLAPSTQAHETKCPHCKLDVVQDTPTQDNEVALRYGRKRIEYRCVQCALTEARTKYTGDLTILGPSETKGKYVVLTRKGGAWSVAPASAVFVGEKVDHKHCHIGYRAFTSRAGFDAHVKKHKALLGDAQALTLAQMVDLAR